MLQHVEIVEFFVVFTCVPFELQSYNNNNVYIFPRVLKLVLGTFTVMLVCLFVA